MASASLAVQPLISLLDEYSMIMLLPKDIPTLQSMVTKNWMRVDNVFATPNTESQVVVCDTDPRQRGPGTDHIPILTTLDLAVPVKAEVGCRNFRETDWADFRKELAEQLNSIPDPCTLLTDSQFQKAVVDLTQAIQKTIETVVPISWPSPHSRC